MQFPYNGVVLMGKENGYVKVEGLVEEALPGLVFKVKIATGSGESAGEKYVLAHPAGKLKMHHIRVIPGDRVLMEMPNINDKRGRIIRRF